MKVKLNQILKEEKEVIGKPDGKNLELIGVSNTKGLLKSQATRIVDLRRYKIIKKNWFAYNPMRVNVGSIGLSYKKEHIGIVSPDYVVFSCSEVILPEYLLFLLKSEEGIEAINKNASGAVRKRLYFKDLARIEIFLPSIKLQKERLKIFKHTKTLHEEFSKKSLLTQLKQAILQEAIQGKLTRDWRAQNPELIIGKNSAAKLLKNIKAEKARLVKEKKNKKDKPLPAIEKVEIPFQLPREWVWCRLGDIIKVSSGDGLTSKQMVEGKIPVFGGNGINGYHNNSNTSEETLTIGRVGAYCGAIHLTPRNAWITDNCFRVYYDQLSLNQEFLIWQLRYLNLGKASFEGSQPVISGKRIYSLLTFLPPLAEQNAIVEKLEVLMEKCKTLEKEISQSEQLSQRLMQAVLKEAFEGEEISKEPQPIVV